MKTETNKTETIKCKCGTVFQWEPSSWIDTVEWLNKMRPDLCDVCQENESARIEAEKRKERIEKTKERFREDAFSSLPYLFQLTDTNHSRFNLSAWEKIKDQKLTEEKPWLGLIGETGNCKTRIASLLAVEEMVRLAERWVDGNQHNFYRFIFTTGYEVTELATIIQTGSFSKKEEARERLDAIRDADVLLIDDLGKGKVTEATAAALFSLIDHRYANLLRTIWTANSRPEQIAAPMSQDMAAPFAGRLNDHSLIFKITSKS